MTAEEWLEYDEIKKQEENEDDIIDTMLPNETLEEFLESYDPD